MSTDKVAALWGVREEDPIDQALAGLYADVRADREAHRARILGELDVIAADLTETLPPELRAAGCRLVYDTEGLAE
ncbi:hypothetical protein ACIBAC_00145 [Streptomyces sp. NPDC051362]|uniref:hypothetical protein n=1 Tax=Streptomyces sp. NPDC051362 TaxID=3365651 RepID=UPI00378F9E2C